MSDSEDDDLVYQQSIMAAARYGGDTAAKHVKISEDKQRFDSATYYSMQEQVMKAAGIDVNKDDDNKENSTN